MKYKSEICKTIHETAKGLYDTEIISLETMQMYDRLCLEKEQSMWKAHLTIAIGVCIFLFIVFIVTGMVFWGA